MKITFLDSVTLGSDINLDDFKRLGNVSVYETTSEEQVKERVGDTDIIIVNKVKLNSTNLVYAQNLKLICVAATGYDNIDTKYCKKNNIAVCNVPGYSTDSVAQLTVAIALSLMIHLEQYRHFVNSGNYSSSGFANCLTPVWHELSNLTWGVVGGGNIGKRVASIAEAFGCNVIICRQKPDADYQCVDIDTLCEKSDIISLHVPLNDNTRGFICRERIEKMKKNVILINTARGAVTDEKAVADAVSSGKIGAFGADVYSTEPMDSTHPFNSIMNMDNVCLTPHIAWGSYESRCRCINEIYKNIESFYEGNSINRVV